MAKQKFKITNWPTYNKALRQRGSLTVWLDESAIAAWTDSTQPEGRGRPLHYTDMAISTVLMMKRVFNLSLRAVQDFVDSIFKMMALPLRCPDYSLVRRRSKTVNLSIKTPTRGEISHQVIDGTGLKVFGEGEWKVRQHGADKRRVWRKLHLAADSATHEIICADLLLSDTADGAYDTRYCHDESGLTFPAFEDLQFYLPQSLRHQPTKIVEVDGLAFLSVLGDGAFCIDPRRWHRIKTYIAKGTVEYPQVSVRDSGVSDGRHRTLLLMQLYNRRTIPVVVPESHYGTFMTEAKNMGAI